MEEQTLNYCSYSRCDNQPQNSLNQITLNIIQKIMCQFTSLFIEHFDRIVKTKVFLAELSDHHVMKLGGNIFLQREGILPFKSQIM